MIGQLTIVTGENAVAVAKEAAPWLPARYRQPVDPAAREHVQFMERLGWFVHAHYGKTLIVPEPTPYPFSNAFRRMLERLSLGYCVRVRGTLDELKASKADHDSAAIRAIDHGALGTLSADSILLVGDRPGPGWRQPRRPNWPFISSLNTGCSVWLTDQLEQAGVPESALCWTNAYNGDGTPRPAEWVLDTGFRMVVALGRHAATWCENNAIAEWSGGFQQVHHPQYWKRVHANKTYHLIKILRGNS